MYKLLSKLNRLNIVLDLQDDKLDIQAPKGVINDELLNEIRASKEELVAFIAAQKSSLTENYTPIPSLDDQESYALSSSQRRLWLLSQNASANVAYNMTSTFKITGKLDVPALEKAFLAVIERHESLRTVFRLEESGDVRQHILPLEASKFKLDCVEITDTADKNAAIEEQLRAEAMYTFDLANDSLLRAKLVKVAAEEYLFQLVMHHIVSDGWSMQILNREVFALYEAYTAGKENPLAPLRTQYKDYAAWQQELLTGEEFNQARSYWQQQFAGLNPGIALPRKKESAPIRAHEGRTISSLLDPKLSREFTQLCKREGCTLFMGVQGMVKLLLFKYLQQKEIIIGMPVAGREHPDLAGQIGFFVNLLALKTTLDKEDTFVEVLQKIKSNTLEMLNHQGYPFDVLMEEKAIGENPFDVVITFENAEEQADNQQELAGLRLTAYQALDRETSKFDLEFVFQETTEGLRVLLTYNTKVYDQELAEQMLEHLQNLLANVVDHSENAIATIELLSPAEKEKILFDFNQTTAPYPEETFIALFEAQVEKTPDAIAVVDREGSLTYAELNDLSNQLANYLHREYQIKAEEIVAVKLERGKWLIASMLGIMKAGAAYLPIDLQYPADRVAYIEQDSQCRLAIDRQFITFFETLDLEATPVEMALNPQHLAYVIYTSGSTGQPKGVMIEHRGLVNLCTWHGDLYQVTNTAKATLFSGIAFDASIWEICPYLIKGATLFPIQQEDLRVDTQQLVDFLKTHKITHCFLPSQICQNFVNEEVVIEGLTLVTGGDVLRLSKASQLNIYNNYGPTENTVVTTAYKLEQDLITNIPIGHPIANTQVYILDESLQVLPIGFLGKLYISGDSLARGYLNRPALTQEKFIENPFVAHTKMYDTGDLAYWLPDGNIAFGGRDDDQVQIRGYRIELGEIEQQLIQLEEIAEAVVAIKERQGKELLTAYYRGKDTVVPQELRSRLKRKLPDYMLPSCFIPVDSIPLTANGKVDKAALPIPTEEDILGTLTLTAPQTALEKQLVDIWKEVLSVTQLGTNTVLFELGGNSINIAKIINKIRSQTDYDLTFSDVYENSTIGELIPVLKKKSHQAIPSAPPSEDYPLTAAQFRFWILCQMPEVNKAYTIPFVMQLRGDLEVPVLEQALQALIARHETLRTSFLLNAEGEVRQMIHPLESINFSLAEEQLSSEEALEEAIKAFNSTPFDLSQAPLFKARLIKTKDASYLLMNFHHIVFDGQSLQVFLQELSLLYNSLLAAAPPALAKLNIQFKDYAVWAKTSAAETPSKEEAFWRSELAGELPILNLPTYQERPLIQTYNGNSISHRFDAATLQKLNAFSKDQQTTSFTTLLAALNGMLSRYTNQDDIIVGTPFLGRDHSDLEHQVGLYINTIPIRTRFNKSDSFAELLRQQKKVLLKAFANAAYSFGDMLDGLNLKRSTSRSPVFDLLVIHQKQNDQSFSISQAFDRVECHPYQSETSAISKYDITFSFLEYDNQLELHVEYNTDLYLRSFIENLIANYENFLNTCLDTPASSIQRNAFLHVAQRQQLVETFNDTKVPYPPEQTFVDLFAEQVKAAPDSRAVCCQDEQISYRELDEKSSQLAAYLQSKGVAQDTTVGLSLGRSVEMVIAILGILKSGASYLPLDPFYPIQRTDYILADSGTKFVLANSETELMLPQGLEVINLDEKAIWNHKAKLQLASPSASSLAYVIYTSGSTGKPKGVKVSHQNLRNFILGMNEKFAPDTSSEVWLAMTSISFDISILELLWTLSRGNNIVLHLERPVPVEEKPEMKFSLFYFPTHDNTNVQGNKYRLLLEGAKFADQKEFEAVWVPERHFHDFGDQFPNPSIAAAAMSTITEKIKLRSGSVVLPLHDPVRVAEQWSMVDNLSNGRVELSIASGWHPNDFILMPGIYEKRHQVMREGIDTLKKAWAGKPLTRVNGIGKDFTFYVHPKPIQKELTLWITAAGSIETFKYAGSIGANILTHLLGQSMEDLEEKIKVYRATLKEHGYDPKKGQVALMLHTFVSHDQDFVKETVEGPFKNYLRNSLNLLKPLAEELGLDLKNDTEPLLEVGFQRFYNMGSLFGTPESCHKVIQKVYEIGVTEIACLIDFGVQEQIVIDNFTYLFDLKETIKRSKHQYDFIVGRMDKLTEAEETAALIERHGVTHMQSTPSFYEEFLLTEKGTKALQRIKTLLVGGEALKKSLAQKLLDQVNGGVYNMYGPTETTIWSSVKQVTSAAQVTLGKPIANTTIYILDAHHQLCPVGVPGELCIGGDGVSLGYLHKEALTAERFIENHFDESPILYKTGDLAYWGEDGELHYQGRLDRQVKVNGYRIELKEIENVILEHSAIAQCAVTTFGQNGHTQLAAYIKSTNAIEEDAIQQTLRMRLPHYMLPQHIVMLDEFPLTPNGKTDIKQLPLPTAKENKVKSYIAPKNETEEKLASLWEDFFGMEQISIDDNFFEIGGNSMKAFQLLSILNTNLGTDLKILSFFQFPTIRTLAQTIDESHTSQLVAIEENEMEDVEDLIDFMNDI